MRIRISEPAALGDLQAYLRSAECAVETVSADELEVSPANAPSAEQARREIEAYLRMWEAMNPPVRVTILD
jgi:hypothetical protein